MCDIQSEAEVSSMSPAGSALSHEEGDRVESFDVHGIRSTEDERDEADLHLPGGCLVRKHPCYTVTSVPILSVLIWIEGGGSSRDF